MNINAIIHEQIEWDGTVKAFQLKADESIGDLWIAFPTDYSGKRDAPFYFLDNKYETIFHSKKADCRQTKLSSKNFHSDGENYFFETTWQRIPTERHSLTYYALYLPEFAIPSQIKVTDTRDTSRQFTKNVFRDDEKNRFVVYIECTSKFGQFNFSISCHFHPDKATFRNSEYHDTKTVEFYGHLDHWKWELEKNDIDQIEKLFITNKYYTMGDQYNVNQAGAVGPNSSASNNTFNQVNYSLPENTDYDQLTIELSELRQLLLSKATLPEHYTAIGEVVQAEEASKVKDGNKVVKSLKTAGTWVLNFAKEIGTKVLSEIIKKQLGL